VQQKLDIVISEGTDQTNTGRLLNYG